MHYIHECRHCEQKNRISLQKMYFKRPLCGACSRRLHENQREEIYLFFAGRAAAQYRRALFFLSQEHLERAVVCIGPSAIYDELTTQMHYVFDFLTRNAFVEEGMEENRDRILTFSSIYLNNLQEKHEILSRLICENTPTLKWLNFFGKKLMSVLKGARKGYKLGESILPVFHSELAAVTSQAATLFALVGGAISGLFDDSAMEDGGIEKDLKSLLSCYEQYFSELSSHLLRMEDQFSAQFESPLKKNIDLFF